ncbi:type II toxin-antitoxin system RelE/ParE family toxin [Polynucleobacter kasalickyi]|uniref:Plasmid stabilization system protein ParE n=1 Tax=Polynucleobacter kasalickyi TaxID=1938817 RepID=A0A1W2AK02_9BURK|nr:type II toxin-antitoxin system RelE/ParE family toxin [Polynucleobacter kasalickyi]SMC60842.1 Plasmid stabilization system protein ParE [Polynucleobacter kasalickyi]
MPQVRLSVRARSDLLRLHKFLVHKDVNVANRAMITIRDAFLLLNNAPMIGRPVLDREELRELVIDFGADGYMALYRFEPALDVLTILAIKHQREDDYN